MVKTVTLHSEIPANRELRVTLPADVPAGSAAIAVTISCPGPSTPSTFGDLLESEFFGMWRDRADIEDSREFASATGWR